jgi:hypothetical protein
MNKKGQSIGLVIGLIIGVASLIIAIIIAFTIVGTLSGSKIIPQTIYTVTNVSDLNGAVIPANTSGHTLNGTTYPNAGGYTITAVWANYYQSNGSAGYELIGSFGGGYNTSLTAANYSVSSTGNFSNGTALIYSFPNVSLSYRFNADGTTNLVASNMTSNFSSGVQQISSKIPTVLLIAAIILILGVLAVLIAMWQNMRGGQGNL